jgi:hypothetical protein
MMNLMTINEAVVFMSWLLPEWDNVIIPALIWGIIKLKVHRSNLSGIDYLRMLN